MIISLHMPKTAGTSFGAALEQHYGQRFLRDYDDVPINTPHAERHISALRASLGNAEKNLSEVECIHGHFLPVKYLLLRDARNIVFVTWLRNPVDRVLSHYYYWKKIYDPKTAPSLHRKVIEENWSLERFCLGPEMRNMYSQFLWGFPLEYFDFVGVTECFESEFRYFVEKFLHTSVQMNILNVGDEGTGGYKIDSSLRESIQRYHAKDMVLYLRALEKQLALRSNAPGI